MSCLPHRPRLPKIQASGKNAVSNVRASAQQSYGPASMREPNWILPGGMDVLLRPATLPVRLGECRPTKQPLTCLGGGVPVPICSGSRFAHAPPYPGA